MVKRKVSSAACAGETAQKEGAARQFVMSELKLRPPKELAAYSLPERLAATDEVDYFEAVV